MAKVNIPFIAPDGKQFDNFYESEFTKRQINGVLVTGVSPSGDKAVHWENRPGFRGVINLGEDAPVDGLYWWVRQNTLVATCNGKTFFIDENGVVNEKTGTAVMVAGVRPSYTDLSGDKLYQASSGKIGGYVAGAGNNGSFIADPEVPTNVTHLATLNKIMIALPANTQTFEWSVVNNAESWDADFASAETETDLALGLYVNNSEIVIVGQSSLEIWRDNGTTFVKELQGYVQTGIIAPDSFTIINSEYFWLSQNREVVRLDGRKQSIISGPYSKMIKRFSTVEDAIGSYVQVVGRNLFVLTFPTEDKTFVFDIENNVWFEWGEWIGTGYSKFIGQNFANCTTWGFTVFGSSKDDGIIYAFDPDHTMDNSKPTHGMIRTDFLNHGDSKQRKFCNSVRLDFKRAERKSISGDLTIRNLLAQFSGENIAFYEGMDTTMHLRYRDNGKKEWSDYLIIPIEKENYTDSTVEVRNLGSYINRQWEFSFPRATDLVLTEIVEDVH